MFVNPAAPNLADFITYCQGQGITPDALPVASDYYQWALTHGIDRTIPTPAKYPPIEYVIACYNYGVNWLINWAPDQILLALTALSWSGGLVTATTALPLADAVGTLFAISVAGAVPAGYNGTFTATNASTDSFTYPLVANPGIATSFGTFNTLFFTNLRASLNILSYTVGPVSSSADQGTSQSLVVPKWLENADLGTMQMLKTAQGRAWIDYEQQFGPSVTGLS
jgi:hypothetical protein